MVDRNADPSNHATSESPGGSALCAFEAACVLTPCFTYRLGFPVLELRVRGLPIEVHSNDLQQR